MNIAVSSRGIVSLIRNDMRIYIIYMKVDCTVQKEVLMLALSKRQYVWEAKH